MSEIAIRPGGEQDFPTLMKMFDGAVAWLVERGRPGQWGTEPFSGNPKREKRVHGMATSGGLAIAEIGGEPAGATCLVETPPAHIPPVAERELYIDLLITAREHTGRGVGGALIEHAREETRRRGISLLRVDCWAGGGGDLVRYYVGQGFTPTVQFEVNGWIGQVFEQRVR
ncbi:GNAT family N-acetyltransferase [Amycolatopsis anabasis]|uniref:GNAT family N-acetyltransferase n=1 Tax=Amycolatopsis anabasis TaxID=1840409 RepID=UPI00131B0BD4|nr:GNAT family N-acetyltransferase [Amycolatopsis anabasis]